MPTISSRLREQREALELSQQALADKCGISARSQRNYESGERLPDAAYLAALATAGADVLYILTGVDAETHENRERDAIGNAMARAKLRTEIVRDALSSRQRALLDNYEHTDEAGKKVIETTASFAAQSGNSPKREKKSDVPGITIGHISGSSHIVSGDITNHGPITFGTSPPTKTKKPK